MLSLASRAGRRIGEHGSDRRARILFRKIRHKVGAVERWAKVVHIEVVEDDGTGNRR